MQDVTTPTKAELSQANAIVKPDFDALPIGEAGFSVIRDQGMIYVDKTALIASLAETSTPILMTRPRRFGKSLLCSTLEDLFAHGTKNFKGLAIEHLWSDRTYPVIKLNFANFSISTDNSDLDRALYGLLQEQLQRSQTVQFLQNAGIDLEYYLRQYHDAAMLLRRVLYDYHDKTSHQFVIIVDEYDSLLTQAINNHSAFDARLQLFSDFFRTIKGLKDDKCLRFVFITGVTRYQHTGIFSGFNNYQDLTFNSNYSALFGYTEEELLQYFGSYIEYGAKLFGMSNDDYLKHLRYEYDGYNFEEPSDSEDSEESTELKESSEKEATAVTKVYNPWSILNSLNALSVKRPALANVFSDFWVGSGSISSFLVNFIKLLLQGVSKEASQKRLLSFLKIDLQADFSMPQSELKKPRDPYNNNARKDLVTAFRVAMVQAGYYTLKELSPSEAQELKSAGEFYCVDGSIPFFLTVPNNEVATYLHYEFWSDISDLITDEVIELLADKKPEFVAILRKQR